MAMENDLGRDNIRQLVWRIAIPSMLAQFVSVLYSIVDRMYIGNIPEVGDIALAGVGVCGPVVTMVGSVAFLIGVGGAPLMSISLGEGNEERARRILANCFVMLLVSAVVLTAVVIPLRRPMLYLFGASDATFVNPKKSLSNTLLSTESAPSSYDLFSKSLYADTIMRIHLSSRSTRLLPMFLRRFTKHLLASISCSLPLRCSDLPLLITQMYVAIPVL